MQFTSLFTLIACVVVGVQATTVANILTDIAAINTRLTSLNNLIQAYPVTGGTLAGALAIHTASVNLVPTINTAATDTSALTGLVGITDAEAALILNNLDLFTPIIQAKLIKLVALKGSLASLPISGLLAMIKADLVAINNARNTFETAFIAKTPATQVARATAFKANLNALFTPALAAFP